MLSPSQLPPRVHLEKFERIEFRNGKPLWKLKAKDGRFFANEEVIQLIEPDLISYRSEQGETRLISRAAKIFTDGAELDRAEMEGDVIVELSSGIKVNTDFAVYSASDEVIYAPREIHVLGQGYELKGIGMELFSGRNFMRILSNAFTKVLSVNSVPRLK